MYANYFLYFCQVKVLRLILTIYFIALLIMPCSDVKAQAVSDNHSEISIIKEHSHSDKSDDACSPFCFCSCCQITVTAFKIDPLLEIPSKIPVYFSKKILFHKDNIAISALSFHTRSLTRLSFASWEGSGNVIFPLTSDA